MANVVGWDNLTSGHIITAVFTMYDAALVHWTVAILFLVYQVVLLIKTRNITLAWVTGIIFASIYASTKVLDFVKPISVQVIFILLVFELGGILYMLLWK